MNPYTDLNSCSLGRPTEPHGRAWCRSVTLRKGDKLKPWQQARNINPGRNRKKVWIKYNSKKSQAAY